MLGRILKTRGGVARRRAPSGPIRPTALADHEVGTDNNNKRAHVYQHDGGAMLTWASDIEGHGWVLDCDTQSVIRELPCVR